MRFANSGLRSRLPHSSSFSSRISIARRRTFADITPSRMPTSNSRLVVENVMSDVIRLAWHASSMAASASSSRWLIGAPACVKPCTPYARGCAITYGAGSERASCASVACLIPVLTPRATPGQKTTCCVEDGDGIGLADDAGVWEQSASLQLCVPAGSGISAPAGTAGAAREPQPPPRCPVDLARRWYLFFTELLVRPGRSLAILLQCGPILEYMVRMVMSSSGFQGALETSGERWLR
mmetsp:Transcript_11279/g.33422  ORF Transcript_11279/g.33422 Transcript_11279/m.33422 type:complete len:238 (+) Transcript_11279:270-983(+)